MTDTEVLKALKKAGEEMDVRIHRDLASKMRQLAGLPYLDIVLANSLIWSGHAKDKKGFAKYACSYFASQNGTDPAQLAKYHMRFGEDGLSEAMHALREIRRAMSAKQAPDFRTCSPRDIRNFAMAVLRAQDRMSRAGHITGVGPWLTKGWVKQVLCRERRLWKDPDVDVVILPTGLEVQRGVDILHRRTGLMYGYNPAFFSEKDHGYDAIVHGYLEDMAAKAGTSALHMNSGVYLLGAGKVAI